MQLNMFDETIELTKQLEEGDESYICNKCERRLPPEAFYPYALKVHRAMADPNVKTTTVGGSGGNATCCKECKKEYNRSWYRAGRKAPPKPTGDTFVCACCLNVKDIRLLRFDHDNKTDKFRGWVCNNCNAGMGNLGDTVEGLQKAINYLNKHNE